MERKRNYHNPLRKLGIYTVTSGFIILLVVMFGYAIPTLLSVTSTILNIVALFVILFTIYCCIIVLRYYNDFYIRYMKIQREMNKNIQH